MTHPRPPYYPHLAFVGGFPGRLDSKESACNAGDRVWSLGWEDPLEKGMATHLSILAWRIPRTEEPGGLPSMGSQRVRHNWATNTWPGGWRSLGRQTAACSVDQVRKGSMDASIPDFPLTVHQKLWHKSSLATVFERKMLWTWSLISYRSTIKSYSKTLSVLISVSLSVKWK